MQEITRELEVSMSEKERSSYKTYDGRGNGNGETSCTITGDHQNRITDYTAIVIEGGQK